MKKTICLLGMLVLMLLPLLAAAEEAEMPVLNPFPDEEAVPVRWQVAEGPLPDFPVCKEIPEGVEITGLGVWGVDPEDFISLSFAYNSDGSGGWTADDSAHYEDMLKITVTALPADNVLTLPLRSVNPAYHFIGIDFSLNPAGVDAMTLIIGKLSLECAKDGRFRYRWADGSTVRYDENGDLQVYMNRKENERFYRVDRVEDPETGKVSYQVQDLNGGEVDLEKLPFRLVDGEETVPLTVP